MPVADTKGVQQTDDGTFESCWNGRESMKKRRRRRRRRRGKKMGREKTVGRLKHAGQRHGQKRKKALSREQEQWEQTWW